MILLVEGTLIHDPTGKDEERVIIFISDEDKERVYRAKEGDKTWIYLPNIIQGKNRMCLVDMVYPGIFEGKKEYSWNGLTVNVLD
jgi:hypothetical protein